jgi:hypothetical protein
MLLHQDLFGLVSDAAPARTPAQFCVVVGRQGNQKKPGARCAPQDLHHSRCMGDYPRFSMGT